MNLPRVAVIYDQGAAGPAEIAAGARGICEPIIICDSSDPDTAPFVAAMSRRFEVVEVCFEAVKDVARVLRERQIDAVTTYSERQMVLTCRAAMSADLVFHSPEVTLLLTDKVAQRTALREAGVDVIGFTAIDSLEDLGSAAVRTSFPAILKPRRGYGSRGVCRVESGRELSRAYAELAESSMILEDYLVGDQRVLGEPWGDYVSVESFVVDGVVQPLFITGKLPLAPPFRERGVVVPAFVPDSLRARLLRLSTAAVEACRVQRGITHVELKLTEGGPRVIEVHGRLGGYVAPLARRALGIDMVRIALRVALGQCPDVCPDVVEGVAMEYFLLAEAEEVKVSKVHKDLRALSVPGVVAVDVRVAPGDRLDWRQGSRSQLGSVHLQCTDHMQALQSASMLEKAIRSIFEFEAHNEESTT